MALLAGRRIINKKIKRAKLLAFFETLPRCVVGIKACGSAHHWGRELRKLGYDVRLMPAKCAILAAAASAPAKGWIAALP